MTTTPRLVCVGNITLDDALFPDGRRKDMCLGGDALYAALGARLFAHDVAMLAPIGADLPVEARIAMDTAGFSPDSQPRRSAPTIRNVVRYEPSGQRSWELLTPVEDFDTMSVYPSDVPANYVGADAFMVAAMSLEAQLAVTSWLRRSTSTRIYLDLQEDYITGREEDVRDLVSRCHVFLPSQEEVRLLLGHSDWVRAARELAKLGPRTVVIKMAAEGSLVAWAGGDQVVHVPAVGTDVVDSTGAGDAFCGAFAAVHGQGGDAVAAARAGSAAASIAISGYGTSALLRASPEEAAELLLAMR